MSWTLAKAKDHLSDVVRRAQAEGPQTISVRVKEVAVIVSIAQFDSPNGPHQKGNFVNFLLSGPLFESVDLTRDRGVARGSWS